MTIDAIQLGLVSQNHHHLSIGHVKGTAIPLLLKVFHYYYYHYLN